MKIIAKHPCMPGADSLVRSAGQIFRQGQPALSFNHLGNTGTRKKFFQKSSALAYRKDGWQNGGCF
ncbi:hypothetical protein [Herbaspirillum sp. meg3]|uniref:hypothetical protein n=1 Tax=Herbaspirillum sp. meg3 TaxID=2025949 RepID=UPI0012FE4C5A|nr:hypothetical protein [Herbaspirillum sp. meg3]